MTTPVQEGAPLTGDEILENARLLVPWLSEHSGEIEKERRLPTTVVERLREAGVFRMNMPKSWGGPEMTSMQQVEVLEELARGDASVGWCAMIGCDSGLFSGYLEDEVARRLYPRLDMVQAGWVLPMGQAEPTSGGYRVSGHWRFASGSTHCDRLDAGCLIVKNGEPVLDDDGRPEWRLMIAQPEDYEILDNWRTTGLAGSGSNDYRVTDLFVAEEHVVDFRKPHREGLLWRRPDALLRKMAGVPLGLGRAAIDSAVEVLGNKIEMPSGLRYRDLPRIQSAVAQAEGLLGGARAYAYDSLGRFWERLEKGDEPNTAERAHLWLSRIRAFQDTRRLVHILYDALGGTAVYTANSALDRSFRDIQTLCQHVIAQQRSHETAGAALLGAESPSGSLSFF